MGKRARMTAAAEAERKSADDKRLMALRVRQAEAQKAREVRLSLNTAHQLEKMVARHGIYRTWTGRFVTKLCFHLAFTSCGQAITYVKSAKTVGLAP